MKPWLLRMLAEAGLPYATYLVLSSHGVSTVSALAVGAVFPLGFVVLTFVRRRRWDGLGLMILAAIVAGLALSLISGDARIALVRDSSLTGAFGLVLLGSLLGRRPLMFYFGRMFGTDGSATGLAAWESFWPRSVTFRRSQRVLTVVWGVAFLGEAAVRVVAAYTLPVGMTVAFSAVLPLAVVALLVLWTYTYASRTTPRSRAEVAASLHGLDGLARHVA
ncbi:MAG: VC0807 family protein [Candidatus Dormibacteria bacterium]